MIFLSWQHYFCASGFPPNMLYQIVGICSGPYSWHTVPFGEDKMNDHPTCLSVWTRFCIPFISQVMVSFICDHTINWKTNKQTNETQQNRSMLMKQLSQATVPSHSLNPPPRCPITQHTSLPLFPNYRIISRISLISETWCPGSSLIPSSPGVVALSRPGIM